MNGILEQLYDLQYMQVMVTFGESIDNIALIANSVLLISGLLFCILGLKFVKGWSAIEGFFVGVSLGYIPALFVDLQLFVTLIIMGVVGILFAILSVVLSRFGMFIVSLMAGLTLGVYLFVMLGGVAVIVGVVFAFIAAILAAILKGPIVIVMTSLQGAILCATGVHGLVGYSNRLIDVAVLVAFAILGILLQFMMKSKEIKTKEIQKAEELRVDHSKEIEVEMARSILDDDE